MTNYSHLYNPQQTPQREQARPDQVENNAGGFVFAIDKWKRLERFLILGSDSSTYYQSARKLTRENAKVVEECWMEDPESAAGHIVDISVSGRAPKNDPAIFAVALGAISANPDARRAALQIVGKVCRTGTHLFQFVAMAKGLGKGFGRGMKRAVAKWYLDRPVDKLAYQVIKYRSREGLTHENLLDLAHPKSGEEQYRSGLFSWLVGKPVALSGLPELVRGHLHAMETTTAKDLLSILHDYPDLPWEALPTWANADPAVQGALLHNMPMTAMIRNLANLTRIGVLKPLSDAEGEVIMKLKDVEAIRKARVHPMAILLALKTYAAGKGMKGQNTWGPLQSIVNAMDGAFYKAFQNVTPAGKRFMLAVDCSDSMTWPSSTINGVLQAREAAAAMALVTMATEPRTHVVGFSHPHISPLPIHAGMSIRDAVSVIRNQHAAGTDCALPMLYALEKGIEADVFVVLTDNETHSGRMHPFEALKMYREKTGIPAKLVVVGMTSTGFSIAPQDDDGCLDVVGFDAAAPAVISDFARG